MPPGKRQQTNPMLYTLIAFVGLFIIATTVAVIFYVKSEEHRKEANTLQGQISDLASSSERQKLGTLVGTRQGRNSWLSTMIDYLDQTISLVVGGVPQPTSAEVKVDTASRKVKETLESLAQKHAEVKTVAPKAPDSKFVELLAGQEFPAAVESFDETMKNAFPAEKLEQAWQSTTTQVGSFKKQVGLRTAKELDYDVEFITCEFERGHLDIKIVYNEKKEIAGLFFEPTPPAVLQSGRVLLPWYVE